MDIMPASTGETAMPTATPSMLASVIRPTAVARSLAGNQLAGTLVHESSRNGCATAMPMVLARTSG